MTKYPCLFDNPVFGNHAPLVLGWSDEQVAPIADRLRRLLPDRLTEQMVLAVASVARSVVSAWRLTGGGVHYPRAKDPYRRPKRYGSGDGRFTWHYITNSTDYLQAAELITQHIGVPTPRS